MAIADGNEVLKRYVFLLCQQGANADISSMFESGEFSDLRIITSEKTFNVHKSVLSAASQELRNIIILQEPGQDLELSECDGTVETIVRHCYGVELNYWDDMFSCIDAFDMYMGADKVRDMRTSDLPSSADTNAVRARGVETTN